MASASTLRPVVFLDRDGTLIKEREYLSDPEGVDLVSGAVEALRKLISAGFAVVVVTNQSGIARGLYSLDDYQAVARRIDGILGAEGVRVDGTYYCPHHPDFTGPCSCRKPSTGLFRRAAGELELDLRRSYFVGDRLKDVTPAEELGGRGILVRTGYGEEHQEACPPEVSIAEDLPEAVELILESDKEAGRGDA